MADLPAERPPSDLTHSDVLLQPSRLLLITTANVTVLGLLPCLGALNWLVVPLCLGTVCLGAAGLWSDRNAQGLQHRPGPYLAAITGGTLLASLSSLRLILGFGLW